MILSFENVSENEADTDTDHYLWESIFLYLLLVSVKEEWLHHCFHVEQK